MNEYPPENNHLYTVVKCEGGVNSEILFHRYPDGAMKVMARYGACKNGFSIEEAVEMLQDIAAYQKELERLGIPLPPTEKNALEYDQEQERAVIVKIPQWTGENVKNILTEAQWPQERERVEQLVHMMFAMLAPLLKERESFASGAVGTTGTPNKLTYDTHVGVDPRCSNFTVDAQGIMHFVDLFPPRYRKNGVAYVEWPKPRTKLGLALGKFKHFDVRGIVLCALGQMARIRPDLKIEFERMTKAALPLFMTPDECREFENGLSETPWIRLRALMERGEAASAETTELVKNAADALVFAVPYGVYSLRELATEFALKNIITPDELAAFFTDSHFEDKLPRRTVNALTKRLLAFLERASHTQK